MSIFNQIWRPDLRRFRRQAGMVAAFLSILTISALSLLMLRESDQADQQVTRTQAELLTLQDVRDLVRQAGSGQGGYLLTGNPRLLEIYQQAAQQLPATLGQLRTEVSDNVVQAGRVASLAARISDDLKRMASSIAQVQAGVAKNPGATEAIANWLQSDALGTSIDSILTDDRRELATRIAAVGWRDRQSLLLVSVGTFVSLVVIALLLYRMRDEARARNMELAGTDAALRDSEQRSRRVFEESPLGILLIESGSKQIVQANPALCRMLGHELSELIGKELADITHIDDHDLLLDADRPSEHPGHLNEIRFLTRSGVVTWARVSITRLSTSDRREALLLGLVENITRQKQVEAQAQKMEAIGQLTGGIAHDFNNLLGVIIGNVEFLIDAVDAEPGLRELAKEILSSALSGADLTRRLLAFARRQSLQPRRIDLNAYLPNHIATLRRLLGESISITTTLAGNLWSTRADPSQVGDALLNLAINARDAMPHGGSICIETSNAHLDADQQDAEIAPGDYVVLAVTDTGIGMPPELLERVMEPFFTTKGPGAGSGLGLSMIYGFAKQSGGHLRIDSEPGRGTTVRLYLPRASDLEADEVDEASEGSLNLGDEAILLVDDNPEMRTVARRRLASLGYRVSEAESGSAALAILQTDDSFDLLFTDIVMPGGMTGYQLAAAAQQLQPGLKVLFTTGYVRSIAGSELVAPHPGAMIRKPYRKQELASKVRATLEG